MLKPHPRATPWNHTLEPHLRATPRMILQSNQTLRATININVNSELAGTTMGKKTLLREWWL